jgi:hypothetical protein
MNFYYSKIERFSGTTYDDVLPKARAAFRVEASKTRRMPYINSKYFGGKVFLGLFWQHLAQKNARDRTRRLAFYACAIDLLKKSREKPIARKNPNGKNEMVYRFGGKTRSGREFYVQVKEDKNGAKHFMSIIGDKK